MLRLKTGRINFQHNSFPLIHVVSFIPLLFILGFANMAHAAGVTIGWDASTDSQVVGYKVSYGNASGNYQNTVDVGNNTTFTLSNIAAGQSYFFAVKAYDGYGNESAFSQELACYTISATAGTNGSIAPAGVTTVSQGSSETVMITPASNYHIADVQVDGVSVGAVSSYTFSNITTPHTISATFAADTSTVTHTITTSSVGQGSISPSGVVTVHDGASETFTISPDSNYQISDVQVDGVSVGVVSSYTFSNVTSDHSISATFEAKTTSSGGGSRHWYWHHWRSRY